MCVHNFGCRSRATTISNPQKSLVCNAEDSRAHRVISTCSAPLWNNILQLMPESGADKNLLCRSRNARNSGFTALSAKIMPQQFRYGHQPLCREARTAGYIVSHSTTRSSLLSTPTVMCSSRSMSEFWSTPDGANLYHLYH